MEYNKDVNLREKIIFGELYDPDNYKLGGIRHFDRISIELLMELVVRKFCDRTDAHNDCPTIEKLIDWATSFPEKESKKIIFGGYCIEPSRNDYRVSIDTIYCDESMSEEFRNSFISTFRDADEFCFDDRNYYAWYD